MARGRLAVGFALKYLFKIGIARPMTGGYYVLQVELRIMEVRGWPPDGVRFFWVRQKKAKNRGT